jgi:hypothetical protein
MKIIKVEKMEDCPDYEFLNAGECFKTHKICHGPDHPACPLEDYEKDKEIEELKAVKKALEEKVKELEQREYDRIVGITRTKSPPKEPEEE